MTRRKISLWLFAATWLAAVALEDGNLSSWDTANRLQVTRWLWTDAPQVVPTETWYGVYGKDGQKYAWTGLGQSLWMLPSQVIGSLIAHKVSTDPNITVKVEEMFVTYTVFPLTSALAVVALFQLFLSLGFRKRTAGLAAMAGFWGTSLLPYTQINQENSLIFLFAVLSFWFALRASQDEKNLWWFAGLGVATGFNFLIRITTAIDTVCVVLFFLFLLPRPILRGLSQKLPGLLVVGACGMIFALLERSYNFYRFGDWLLTYYDVMKSQRPEVLYEGNIRIGLPGLLWSIKTNVWQFDPLAALALLALPISWAQLPALQKKMAGITALYALLYILFYASRPFFDGDSAWGSRYTTSPMILLGSLGVAVVLESSRQWLKKILIPVTAIAIFIQVSSTFFWYSLEEVQQEDRKGISESMVILRMQNITAYCSGRWEEWDLLAEKDSLRQRTPNYFPFLSSKYLPRNVNLAIMGCWLIILIMASLVNLRLLIKIKNNQS